MTELFEQLVTQAGIPGILVVLLLRLVFVDFLGKGNGKLVRRLSKMEDTLERVKVSADANLQMHQMFDNEGRPVWYFQARLGEVLQHVEESLNTTTQVLRTIAEDTRKVKKTADSIERKVCS